MGFVKDIGKSVVGAVTGIGDTLGGRAAYNPDEKAFKSAEIARQTNLAKKQANVGIGESKLAQKQQLQIRADEIKLARALGKISQEQADIALGALAEQNALAEQQQANIDALTAQAEGTGPSLAQDALTNATDRNNKQIMGQIASQRGVQPGQALRVGLNTMADANQQAASDAATLRLQEQMAARDKLSGVLANTRGQAADQGTNATNTQLAASGQQGNVLGGVRTQDIQTKQLAEDKTMKNQVLASGNAEAQRQAQIEKEKIKTGLASDARKAQSEMIAGIGGGVAMAASDENAKKDISDADIKIKEFLEAVSKASKNLTQETFMTSDENLKTNIDVEKPKTPEKIKAEKNKKFSDVMRDASLSSDKKVGMTIGKGIGSLVSMAVSDEDLKENSKIADMSVKNFLDALKAHEYKYKESAEGLPGVDDKKHISPMAQEFEKTDMGKGMVVDTPEGKIVDYAKSAGALFASLAHINERIKKLEGQE